MQEHNVYVWCSALVEEFGELTSGWTHIQVHGERDDMMETEKRPGLKEI